jgi:hypothetical protein
MFDAPVGLAMFVLAVVVVVANVAWLALGHHLRTVQLRRQHDPTDANCIFWNGDNWYGLCSPCRADGGYVARRHAQIRGRR